MNTTSHDIVGQRVRVDLEKPNRTERGVVLRVGPSGVRVRFDTGKERVVAAWRISRSTEQ